MCDAAFEHVPIEWNVDTPDIRRILDAMYQQDDTCPKDVGNVFHVLRYIKPADVKVVILGQDPYPRQSDACGIAFMAEHSMPHSARSIRDNLLKYGHISDADVQQHCNGVFNLRGWIEQGVLLMNTSLTVKAGTPNAYREVWRGVVQRMLKVIPHDSVTLHLGDVAATVATPSLFHVFHTHPVIPDDETFQTKDCFGEVNYHLKALGKKEISWNYLYDF